AQVFQVIGGVDRRDATSSAEAMPDAIGALDGNIKGLRIGVPKAFLAEGIDADVLRAFNDGLQVLQSRGATLVDIELPHAGYGIPVYYLVA
ncbi:amidase family protein, partial [Enterococcus casseliflavus]|uniref:amidase family protein n=1 Tax=Enterococcus casseliflavus TaxID=37734 RepID=UPI003D102165